MRVWSNTELKYFEGLLNDKDEKYLSSIRSRIKQKINDMANALSLVNDERLVEPHVVRILKEFVERYEEKIEK